MLPKKIGRYVLKNQDDGKTYHCYVEEYRPTVFLYHISGWNMEIRDEEWDVVYYRLDEGKGRVIIDDLTYDS